MELTRPLVMGIVNVTPDSFYEGSRASTPEEVVTRVGTMLGEGADIVDIGACSTRPGSVSVDADEEIRRLEGPLEAVRRAFPEAVLSLDTFRASVADECIRRWSVDIVNDISGGADPDMFRVVGNRGVPYVLTHMRGTPADMDSRCSYGDVVADVTRELAFRLNEARLAGIADVFVDPGFGFAKTVGQNLLLLRHLVCLEVLGCPLLVGISRKRMARIPGSENAAASLASTVALNAVAVSKGAAVIRVHDVTEGVAVARSIGRLWNLD